MTKKSKKLNSQKGYPIDDRPVIFSVSDTHEVNFIGRYIESEGMFLLSLNNVESDFIPQSEISEWWYVDEHPTVMKEVFGEKIPKKDKAKKEEKPKYKVDDSENKTEQTIPTMMQPPPFLKEFVENIQQQMGFNFPQSFTVRMVGEEDLPTFSNEVLEQILQQVEKEENWELAIKVRDAIKSKSNEE